MAVFLRTLGEEFEILVLVNLDESDAIGAVLALQHVWFLVPRKSLITLPDLRFTQKGIKESQSY